MPFLVNTEKLQYYFHLGSELGIRHVALRGACVLWASICGNKRLPVRFGRPVASRSVRMTRAAEVWQDNLFAVKVEKGKRVRPLFRFLCPDRKQNNDWLGEVGARAGNPPPALVLSLRVDRELRRGSLLVECALPRKGKKTVTKRCHSALISWCDNQHKPIRELYLFSTLTVIATHTCN